MNFDIALLLASTVFTVLLAAVGIEMANNPPASGRAKWLYRSIFIVLGSLLVGTTSWQGKRNMDEQARIAKESSDQRAVGDARYNQLQGRLDNITQFVAHPPSDFHPEQILAAVRAMAKNAPKPTQQPQTTIGSPYGNLAARCTELGNAIIAAMDERAKSRPDPGTNRQAYNEWYRLNDGVYFHAPYYRQVSKIRQELADLHIDDQRLDELVQKHEQGFAARQQNPQAAIDSPPMFHLSIEELREIGERLKFLATQIPHS